MTLRDRAKLGGAVSAARAAERAETLRQLLEQGECLKRAAWKAGMAYRTARRHRRRFVG